ncbi:hypothetical protein AMAG_08168 [Allomyces macrogynus ATCC 38327]|uniref:Uncharacterized protein n=1 Tax=Allomyces macrogynus (strain ATCC 38327) TaxID=578462 RepID=A0A0L0SKF8_ALLM3|nr:hypothetical protein AMAG_08168 [Allomyces macrogynus ATCC 38327]|eukprot:KNE62996.1 hypothetical protein AMAG_08168 [Allomyces macrogynus ATCC 38327]
MLSTTTTAPVAPAAPPAAAPPTKNSNLRAASQLACHDPIFPPDLPTTDPAAAAAAWPLLVANRARLQDAVKRYAQHVAHADAAARSAMARADAAERALAVVAHRLETAVVPTAEARVRAIEAERDVLARRVRQLEAALVSTEAAFVRAREDARHWRACERVVPAPVVMAEREIVTAVGAVDEPAPDMDVTRLNAVIEGHIRSLDHDHDDEDGAISDEGADGDADSATDGRAARPAISSESVQRKR